MLACATLGRGEGERRPSAPDGAELASPGARNKPRVLPTAPLRNHTGKVQGMTTMRAIATGAALVLAAGAAQAQAPAGSTFDAVKNRGQLVCGVSTGLAGFSLANSQGEWTGIDVDVCKAVAAAMFGDAKKVKFVPLSAQQ